MTSWDPLAIVVAAQAFTNLLVAGFLVIAVRQMGVVVRALDGFSAAIIKTDKPCVDHEHRIRHIERVFQKAGAITPTEPGVPVR